MSNGNTHKIFTRQNNTFTPYFEFNAGTFIGGFDLAQAE